MGILFVIVSNCEGKMIAETLKTITIGLTSFIMIYVSTSVSTADSSIIQGVSKKSEQL